VALPALLGVTSAFATSNDALLDLLVKKGVLTEAEATSVAAELKEENKGVTFSAKGSDTVKVRFNGRLHYQYDSLDADYNGADQASTNHFYFRRLRFGAKATHESGIFAEMVFDMAEDDFGIDTAIAGYEFNDHFTGIIGYQKVPFGFEETTSSNSIKTIERSAANRFIVDDLDFAARHSGLHAEGNLGGGFSYAAAVVNGVQGEGSRLMGASNASNDLGVFGSVRWEGNGLTLGVDAGHKSNQELVDGSGSYQDVTAFTGYAHYNFNGFDVLGEYFHADLDDLEDFNGYALRLAYKLGKFEPVVRYSYGKADMFEIDVDELVRRAPKGTNPSSGDNEIESYYAGLNYYYNKAVSLMLGYEIAEAEDDSGYEVDVDGFRARVKVLW
ncbi:MAG TPA: porin, partial [Opitutales bacterium]|nr:porin [Opitutales bacterium]